MSSWHGLTVELAFNFESSTYRAVLASAHSAEVTLADEPLATLLHTNEAWYMRSLRSDRRRESYLLGRAAAKRAICVQTRVADPASIEIVAGVFGQPVVRHTTGCIDVSITHTDAIGLAVAFPAEHPLGIDVETVSKVMMRSVADHIDDAERSLLVGLGWGDDVGLAMLWSAKEALSKILRCGLAVPLRVLAVSGAEPAGSRSVVVTFENFTQYSCHISALGESVLALAVPRRSMFSPDVDRLSAIVCGHP
jgi:4'-phosphopantetheinyl transferase